MENYNENNTIELGGTVVSAPELSHEIYEEKFYKFSVETKRLSSMSDILPIIVSERLINVEEIKVGKMLHIVGQVRSYNKQVGEKSKLVLSVFAKEIEETEDESILTLNDANFNGYLCKAPIYRKTPLGREISDVLVAVNRSYKKSDYIPCILWGRNAKFSEKLAVGTNVRISGRIQSRKYEKVQEDGTTKEMTAYELSASKFSIVKEEEREENTEEV